jgi:hypothetical protein
LDLVQRIEQELKQLRAGRQLQRDLQAAVRGGNRRFRQLKQALQPALAADGMYYHGDAIRHRRRQPSHPNT